MSETYKKSDDGSWIEVTGFVRRLLTDDNGGSCHQRFIIDIGNRHTLLIAHNMYEWNDLGGLVHWTHHDPHSVEDGGYVSYRTKKYE
jgi:hypothetical protein